MNLIINDKSCTASIGQTISKAARVNHSHVGYLCGGHGVCQTCQVTVLAGAEYLSPVNDVENAFLTPDQIAAGVRMACRATIIREGEISVLSRPEEVRRMLFTNPLPLFNYGAEIGRGVASQMIPGLGNLAGRLVKGEILNEDELGDFKDSVDGLFGLTVEMLPEYIPFKDQVMEVVRKLPVPFFHDQPLLSTWGVPNSSRKTKEVVEIKYTPRRNQI